MFYKTITILLISAILVPISFAYTPTQKDKQKANNIFSILKKQPIKKQTNLITKIEKIKTSPRLSWKKKYILLELENSLRNKTFYSTNKYQKASEKNIKKLKLDIPALRKQWIDDLNGARREYKVSEYSYNKKLDYVSQVWSNQAYKRWKITHEVDPGDAYYDYWKKAAWAENKGLVCKNKSRATFSESIAWWDIYCSWKNDCQKQFSESLTWVYDMFMAEKGLPYPQDAHYRAIVHPEFNEIGLAFTLKHKKWHWYTYYMTNYYCTDIIE